MMKIYARVREYKENSNNWQHCRWANTTPQISFHTAIKQLEKDGKIARPKTFQVIRSFTHECNYNVSSTYNVQAIILGTERSMANIIDTGSSFYVEKQIWNSRKMQIKIVEPVSRLMGGKATSEYFGRLLCKKNHLRSEYWKGTGYRTIWKKKGCKWVPSS